MMSRHFRLSSELTEARVPSKDPKISRRQGIGQKYRPKSSQNRPALEGTLTEAIAKRLAHAKNQLSMSGSFFNQFVTDIYIYIYIYTH